MYAGEIRVNITDWFFFKKNAVLKNVAVDNAIIKFQRTDSVWSQQFLFDYFAPSSTKKSSGGGIQFSLNKLIMNNVTFKKTDGWVGKDMVIYAGTLKLDADGLKFSGPQYKIKDLLVDQPVVVLKNYTGKRPRDTTAVTIPVDPDLPPAMEVWNTGNMLLQVDNLKINNGTFINDKETQRGTFSYFDGQHILFTAINADIKNAQLGGDSVIASLRLSAKERSGVEVKHLISDVKMTPQGMYFNKLDLLTNRSQIRDYFSMSYNGMWDMSDFVHKVKISGNMNGTSVNSDDIAFFAPALSSWKKTISLKGRLKGTVADWTGRDLDIAAGNNTLLNGDITMTGLPDIRQTFIDFKANNFSTTYDDAVTIVPAIRNVKKVDLQKIRYVNFKGSFTGFVQDFVTFGTISTNLGTLTTDLNMKLPARQDPVYSGNIATDNFMLGEFLDDKDLGAISLTGTVKGKGFTDKSLNTMLDGTIRFADYKNYRYNNITVNGKLDKKLFEGFSSIRDENLHLDLKGIIDFNGPSPRFDLMADVEHANFNKLHFTEDTVLFKGKLNFNFTSKTIDDFLGTARITDGELIRNGFKLPFDSLIVQSSLNAGQRELSVHSNEIDATVSGHFSLTEFPGAATYLLNRYYPAYVSAPKKMPGKQSFHFDVLTYNVDDYIRMIHPKLSGFNNSHFVGDIDLEENKLDLVADVPEFKFRGYNFSKTIINATGRDHDLSLNGITYNIGLNDSLNIPFARFSINARNDSSLVSIFSGANQAVDTANLNALVLTYQDGVKIEFDPSTFTINGKLWSIDESGELSFRRNIPVAGKLLLREGDQQILLKTQPSANGDWNDFIVDLTAVNLGDISPLVMPHNRMEGLLSGNILIENPMSKDKMSISSKNLHTQFFRLDNDSLGEVLATAEYKSTTKELKLKGETANKEEYLGFDGSVYIGDPEKTAANLIALKARNFPLKVLERFLGNLFTDIRGSITGDINLAGDFKHISVYGKGSLKKAGLKVNFTQCFYWIKDTEINMKPTELDLTGIVLTDSVTKNPIYLTGGIQHEAFRNMFYDLYISTRKPNTLVSLDKNGVDANNKAVLLLNTTQRDNSQFFGRVKGTGSLSLTGPQSDMFMKIDAIASVTDSSNITIPSSRSRESGLADFLVERKYGREMTESDFVKNDTRITYDVDVTANPHVNVKVVMDELTGDEINGRGSGTLNIRSGTTDPLYLNGRFDILEGSYLFTFQSFFKKPFEIRKNAENYIEWNGDPFDANIKFEASYRAERVSFDQLATTLKKVSTGASSARGDVYVIAKLTNKLFSPDIKFSLDFPSTSVAVTDPELALIFKQIQNNPNEVNRQATYLIVFNSFAPSELGGDLNGKSGLLNINTISGIILNVLNDQLNKILGNLFKNEKYNFTLNTSLYTRSLVDQNSNTALNLGSNVNFSVGRSFFDNRFIISAGGGFDAPLQQQTTQQGIQFLKDVTLEWLINPSGSIRVSFFYKENADYLTTISSTGPGKAKRIGGNLSYRKDFDRLGDIFRKKQKPPPPVKTETPANVPPSTQTDPKKD